MFILVILREINDKIALGEEQVQALRESIRADEEANGGPAGDGKS